MKPSKIYNHEHFKQSLLKQHDNILASMKPSQVYNHEQFQQSLQTA